MLYESEFMIYESNNTFFWNTKNNYFFEKVGDYGMNFIIYSIFGCPLQCPRDKQNNLCSNNGICDWDTNIYQYRCFCYNNET